MNGALRNVRRRRKAVRQPWGNLVRNVRGGKTILTRRVGRRGQSQKNLIFASTITSTRRRGREFGRKHLHIEENKKRNGPKTSIINS